MIMFLINPVNWVILAVKSAFQLDYRSAYLEMIANIMFIITVNKSEAVLITPTSGRLVIVSYKLFKFFVFIVPVAIFVVGEIAKGIAWIVAQVPFPEDEFEEESKVDNPEQEVDKSTVPSGARQGRPKAHNGPTVRTKTPN